MMTATVFLARSATRLSCLGGHSYRFFSKFRGLARLSLSALALSMLPACLVDDPPPFTPPQKTPPRLDYSRALPGLDQITSKRSGELIPFSVPVTSEDAGDPLSGVLLLDYGGDGTPTDFAGTWPGPASTLNDKTRVVSVSWLVRPAMAITAGCHRLTLRVTHLSNLAKDQSVLVIDKEDLAEAFWFVNVNVTPENANSLANCPQGSSASATP